MPPLLTLAESDPDAGVRRSALLAVAEHRGSLGGVAELPARAARHPPSEDNRALARELLQPRRSAS